MAGTVSGGKAAAATNKRKYGSNFYAEIALKAQAAYKAKPKAERKPRGFAANRELAKQAGKLGGTISRRK